MNFFYEWLNLRRLGFVIIFIGFLGLFVLADPDYFWHLRTGQYILDNINIPSSDIFSYTFFGSKWVLHEWLFEVILYGVHTITGEFGVKFLAATLTIATLLISYKTIKKITSKPWLAFYLVLLMVYLITPNISPRPQLITFFFFSYFLHILMAFKYFNDKKYLWTLPILMVIWVNSHGGFIAGIALISLFSVCELVKFTLKNDQGNLCRHNVNVILLTLILVILSTLLNPNFVHLWTYPFDVMKMEAAKTLIDEWLSPSFHDVRYQVYLALVLLAFTFAIFRVKKPDLTEIVLALFFSSIGFVSARHVPLAILILVIFVATTFSQLDLSKVLQHEKLNHLKNLYNKNFADGSDIGKGEFLINWSILVLTIVGFMLFYQEIHASDKVKMNEIVPINATEFIIESGVKGNVFNVYHYGGYLIYRLYPQQKVFIDGRGDMYGDKFILEYIKMQSGLPGWRESFEKYKIDYVITSNNSVLVELLQTKSNFILVFKDEINSVLVKNNVKFSEIITKYKITN